VRSERGQVALAGVAALLLALVLTLALLDQAPMSLETR
jgi:hypothetical protein